MNPLSRILRLMGLRKDEESPKMGSTLPQSLIRKLEDNYVPDGWTREGVLKFLGWDGSAPGPVVGEAPGQYQVAEIHAIGGMGVVLRCKQLMTGDMVALKFAPTGAIDDKFMADRFVEEAVVLARVNSENVVRVTGFGRHNGLPFLVCEFVDGVSLDSFVEELWPPGVESLEQARVGEVHGIAVQAARGLAAIHATGTIHRDVKPGNVMVVRPAWIVKVIDLGLAKAFDSPHRTTPGWPVGTPAFMSPEQARGKSVDPRSDLFSLGLVFFYLVTGKKPYPGNNTEDVLKLAREGEIQGLDRLAVPDERLRQVITGLLKVDPSARIQSAAEVAAILIGTHASPPDPPPPAPKGKILSPSAGAQNLSRAFRARVEVSGVPPGHHLWLTVERDGGCWPKKPEVRPAGGTVEQVVHEGGPARVDFDLSLWLVPEGEHQQILDWFSSAASLGWLPLPLFDDVPDAQRLDRVERVQVR
jgi:serine/threonine protein kinase